MLSRQILLQAIEAVPREFDTFSRNVFIRRDSTLQLCPYNGGSMALSVGSGSLTVPKRSNCSRLSAHTPNGYTPRAA